MAEKMGPAGPATDEDVVGDSAGVRALTPEQIKQQEEEELIAHYLELFGC